MRTAPTPDQVQANPWMSSHSVQFWLTQLAGVAGSSYRGADGASSPLGDLVGLLSIVWAIRVWRHEKRNGIKTHPGLYLLFAVYGLVLAGVLVALVLLALSSWWA